LFQDAKGFDHVSFPEYLFDLDLCLRLRGDGVENVFTPFCRAVCTERQKTSATLSDQCPRERALFQERWQSILIHNPYYNENQLLQENDISRNQWMKWVAGAVE
jgi:GT2 family glycosyltransferase